MATQSGLLHNKKASEISRMYQTNKISVNKAMMEERIPLHSCAS
jgi:hypothetical protein